ncbi:MAG TPA: T9SS type A sorting domain-containing protein [Bacteroidales bacterium]|nr:T9SS type A sorting domain-containing protein [Bacteroidales bacterium]
MNKIFYLPILLFLMVFPTSLFAQQELISTAGAAVSAGNNTVEWSVGECVVAPLSISSGSITQGFHQPEYVITTTEISQDLNYELNVFPVPATNYLRLKTKDVRLSSLKAYLYDMNGKEILTHDFASQGDEINVTSLSTGQYILRITDKDGKFLKSFNVVKQ